MTDFNEIICREGTFCTQWDYIADRFGTPDVLPFSISDMDLACPPSLMQAMTQRLEHPVLGYSRWRHEEYLGAIQKWYRSRYDTYIEKNWITYSPSVMYSIAKTLELVSVPGDNVLIFTPVYNSFFDVIVNSNRNIIQSPLIYSDGRYEIDWDNLLNKLSQCAAVLFCSPHNPVGKCWSDMEINKLIILCEQRNIWLLSDEIHCDFIFNTEFSSVLNYLYDKSVVFNSISKTFNVPALTGSYLVCNDEWFNERFQKMIRYRDFVNSPSILNVIATIDAYSNCGEWLNQLKCHIKNNICIARSYILDRIPSLSVVNSNATYLLWIDCNDLNCTDKQLQEKLIAIGKVGIMSGSTYGTGGDKFLRLNLACSSNKLLDGLKRLELTVNTIIGDRS